MIVWVSQSAKVKTTLTFRAVLLTDKALSSTGKLAHDIFGLKGMVYFEQEMDVAQG